jgi:hypothetical protein
MVSGASSQSTSVFEDNFDDNVIDSSFWEVEEAGGPYLVETNQRLEMYVPSNSSGSLFKAYDRSKFLLHSDFDIQVDYTLLTWPPNSGVMIGVGIDYIGVERASRSHSELDSGEVYSTDYYGDITYLSTSDTTGKLRLVRRGSMMTGYYWNGGTWIQMASGSVPSDDSTLTLGIWGNDYTFSDSYTKIAFDNFRVNSGEIIYLTSSSTTNNPTAMPTSSTPFPVPTAVGNLWGSIIFPVGGLIFVGFIIIGIYTYSKNQKTQSKNSRVLSERLKAQSQQELRIPESDNVAYKNVFISYSHEDKPIADAVCNKLESQGIRCWVAPRDVRPGANFQEAIIDAIASSRIMVLIFTSHSNRSQHVIRELTSAVSKNVIIIPFKVEDVPLSKSMEYLISVPHWLDAMTPPLENHIEELTKTVQSILKE